MKREESIDYNIKSAWHAISRMYNHQAAKYDMTMSVGFVLLNIDYKNGTPATKIAPLLGLETRSLTRILKTLEERGLIYREQDPDDGRSVRIFLTDEGKYGRGIARQTVKAFNQKVKEKISEDQLKNFFQVIKTIHQLIDQNNIYNHLNSEINNETYN
ncbi:MAG: MarR family transcriptional regulator [Bacteroidota bacterium]